MSGTLSIWELRTIHLSRPTILITRESGAGEMWQIRLSWWFATFVDRWWNVSEQMDFDLWYSRVSISGRTVVLGHSNLSPLMIQCLFYRSWYSLGYWMWVSHTSRPNQYCAPESNFSIYSHSPYLDPTLDAKTWEEATLNLDNLYGKHPPIEVRMSSSKLITVLIVIPWTMLIHTCYLMHCCVIFVGLFCLERFESHGWSALVWMVYRLLGESSVLPRRVRPSAFKTRAKSTRSLSQSDERRLNERYIYS